MQQQPGCRQLSESHLLSESDDDDLTSMTESLNDDLYLSSKHLRRKMRDVTQQKDADRETIDGPHNEDALEITIPAAEHRVPVELYNHIAWMLTDIDYTTGKLDLSTKTHDLVLSICQDLVSYTTKLPMPKHVGPSVHILRTRDLVTILNRFGHCISYIAAQRYITAMANKMEADTALHGVFIPEDLKNGVFFQCAFDNLDFAENTKDELTTHATSHIFYQYNNV